MTIQELIERYGLSLEIGADGKPTGRIYMRYSDLAKKNGDVENVKSHRQEIKDTLLEKWKAEREAAAARQAKIDAIPGLTEIRAAKNDLVEWHREFNESFENVGGLGVRPKPTVDIAALEAQFPRAAAYLKAEAWSYGAHYAKVSAGKKALEKIINGEDCEKALAEMDKEWTAYCNEHAWD